MSPKLKFSKESKVGIIILAAIAIFYFGINYLQGINLFSPSKNYFAKFNNADMLLTSAPVTLSGLQVGVVEDIFFKEGNTNLVIVKIRIHDNDLKIPQGTIAHIKSDLLGVRTVYLEMGSSANLLNRGDTLSGKLDSAFTDKLSSTMLPMKGKVESLIVSIDSVLMIVRGVFNKKTQNGLVSSFESINRTILNLENSSEQMNELIGSEKTKISELTDNLKSITQNIRKNNDKLSNIFSNVDKITDDVAKSNVKQTMVSLEKSVSSIQSITEKIEKGEGTVGSLVGDKSLFNNLQKSVSSLNSLLEDMKANPERYITISVFGKKKKK